MRSFEGGFAMTTPRIYVSSLSDYNAGRLHGVWIDAPQDVSDIADAVAAMLKASPEARRYPTKGFTGLGQDGGPAEEWAIHDYEGFGSLKLSEYESFERVSELAQAIEVHGEAFIVYCEGAGGEQGLTLAEGFEESYQGSWDSLADYAYDCALETASSRDEVKRLEGSVWPFTCIDWERAGRELVMGGDIWTTDAENGIYVFTNY